MPRSSLRHNREFYQMDSADETAAEYDELESNPHPPTPNLLSAAIDALGTTLTLTFSMDVASTDETGFVLTADGVEKALSGLSITDAEVTMTCEAVLQDEVCVISYDGSGDLASTAGQPVTSFVRGVTNGSTQT